MVLKNSFDKSFYLNLKLDSLSIDEIKSFICNKFFFQGLEEFSQDNLHSSIIDRILGLNIDDIEADLSDLNQSYYNTRLQVGESQKWFGLDPQVLQTPYQEICEFFELLKHRKIDKVIDLGAGYGRVAIVMQSFFPQAKFAGYEIVNERVNEGNRIFAKLGIESDCQMFHEDITAWDSLPSADLFFIYDFSEFEDVRKILTFISESMYKKKFFVVARGDGIRSMIQLKYPEIWCVNGAIHKKNWSLYSSFCDLNSNFV